MWYSMDACRGETITVQINFLNAIGDLDATMHSSDGSIVASGTSVDDNETLVYDVVVSETLRVVLYSLDPVIVPYTVSFARSGVCADLTVSTTIPPTTSTTAPLGCMVDAFEPNDDPASAVSVYGGSGQASICPGDDDWYAIQATSGAAQIIRITFLNDAGDLDMALYDEGGALVGISQGTIDLEEIVFTSTQQQLLYLYVYGYGGSENHYTIQISSLQPPTTFGPGGCVDDANINNDPVSATPLAFGTSQAAICGQDEDWYRVDVCADGTLAIHVVSPEEREEGMGDGVGGVVLVVLVVVIREFVVSILGSHALIVSSCSCSSHSCSRMHWVTWTLCCMIALATRSCGARR